nr:MAG TPA: hypothetical protein [Caudoviricetes sp.]
MLIYSLNRCHNIYTFLNSCIYLFLPYSCNFLLWFVL